MTKPREDGLKRSGWSDKDAFASVSFRPGVIDRQYQYYVIRLVSKGIPNYFFIRYSVDLSSPATIEGLYYLSEVVIDTTGKVVKSRFGPEATLLRLAQAFVEEVSISLDAPYFVHSV